jgi:hypothetical protein
MSKNLTHERLLKHLISRRDQELALTPVSETVVETVVDQSPGKAPKYSDRRVSKRDFLAREHNERITKFAAEHGLSLPN